MSMAAEGSVTSASSRALGRKARLQRALALLTVGIPTLGFVVAAVQVVVRGVRAMELTLLAVMYLATVIGVEGGLHRYFSHRACRGGTLATQLLGILGSMAGQGPILFWAAIHRAHHAHMDRPGDPHSPWLTGPGLTSRARGLFHAHVGWLFTTDDSNWQRWVPDLLRRRDVMRLNQSYPLWLALGLLIPAVAGGLWEGSLLGALSGALWGGLVRMFLLDQVTWAINSLGHLLGKRPYPSGERSGNIAWLALPSAGGSWHNNHHAYPALARNDIEPWQVDLTGYFFELLALLRLVTDVHRPRRFRKSEVTDIARRSEET